MSLTVRIVRHRVSLKGEPLMHRSVRFTRHRWMWQLRLPGNRTLAVGVKS